MAAAVLSCTDSDDDGGAAANDDDDDDDDSGADRPRPTIRPGEFLPVPLGDTVTCNEAIAPPLLDGEIHYAEWSWAAAYEGAIDLVDPQAQDIPDEIDFLFLAGNDAENLFLGWLIQDPTLDDLIFPDGIILAADVLTIYFDVDRSGVLDAGDDARDVVPFWGTQYADLVGTAPGQVDYDRRYDGFCRIGHDDERYHVECRLLLAADDAQDFFNLPGDSLSFNARYIEHLDPDLAKTRLGLLRGRYNTDAIADWITLETVASARGRSAEPPVMTGLLTFVSFMDDRYYDLYFAEASGDNLINLTPQPVHIMNPSLAKGGTRIAFHGAAAEDDYAGYEIWTIKTDGTELTRLTDNNLLDGHPGWSPDGEEIVYVTFTNESPDQGGQIFIMNRNGSDKRRITFTDSDENDPDFSPSGERIVFKSMRWTGKEQIATMDLDGGDVLRLTDNEVSDHDPIYSPDGRWIVFERYEGPGDWFDPYNLFAYGWNIYVVAADGGKERKLTDDGYVNWLPVFSPDGKYILYQKTLCPEYTPLYLVDLAGGDEWPVLPQWTKLVYIDWR